MNIKRRLDFGDDYNKIYRLKWPWHRDTDSVGAVDTAVYPLKCSSLCPVALAPRH
jgi:hypothetical protein